MWDLTVALAIQVCADTLVGDQMRRGISGGQKKRVTTGLYSFCLPFAARLVTNVVLLLCNCKSVLGPMCKGQPEQGIMNTDMTAPQHK